MSTPLRLCYWGHSHFLSEYLFSPDCLLLLVMVLVYCLLMGSLLRLLLLWPLILLMLLLLLLPLCWWFFVGTTAQSGLLACNASTTVFALPQPPTWLGPHNQQCGGLPGSLPCSDTWWMSSHRVPCRWVTSWLYIPQRPYYSVDAYVVCIVSNSYNHSFSALFFVVFKSVYWCVKAVFNAGKSSSSFFSWHI